MSTQPTITPEAEAGIESARTALAAALSGKPAAGAPPAAQPSTPPTEAAPAAPGISSSMPAGLLPTPPSPAPSPTGTPTAEAKPVPPQFTDPAASRYLEMHGGNVEAALAKALRDNNRLAQLAKAAPDLFKPGAPADPTQPVAPEAAPSLFVDPATVAPEAPPVAPEIPMNWEQITAEADRVATEVDQVCRGYTQQWIQNDRAIKESAQEVQSKQARMAYIDSLLKDNSIELSELKAEDFKDERRTLLSEIGALKQDAMLRVLQNRELDQAFTQRRSLIFDNIAGQFRAQAQEQAFTTELQRIESTEFQRLSQTWPGAVSRAVEQYRIPQDLVSDFTAYAKQMASAAVSTDPNNDLADVDGFLSTVAKGYVERLDRYHRAQAAQYGQLAVTRAATPSPAPPAGTPAPVSPNPQTMTPEEAMLDAERFLRQRLRG